MSAIPPLSGAKQTSGERVAGRSADKLQKVRADIGAPDDLPLVKADATDPASLRSMCERAAVIITAVGP